MSASVLNALLIPRLGAGKDASLVTIVRRGDSRDVARFALSRKHSIAMII